MRPSTGTENNTPLPRYLWPVARLVRQGKTNREIARILGLSPETPRMYVHRIARRLRLRNRTAIAVWVLRHPKGSV